MKKFNSRVKILFIAIIISSLFGCGGSGNSSKDNNHSHPPAEAGELKIEETRKAVEIDRLKKEEDVRKAAETESLVREREAKEPQVSITKLFSENFIQLNVEKTFNYRLTNEKNNETMVVVKLSNAKGVKKSERYTIMGRKSRDISLKIKIETLTDGDTTVEFFYEGTTNAIMSDTITVVSLETNVTQISDLDYQITNDGNRVITNVDIDTSNCGSGADASLDIDLTQTTCAFTSGGVLLPGETCKVKLLALKTTKECRITISSGNSNLSSISNEKKEYRITPILPSSPTPLMIGGKDVARMYEAYNNNFFLKDNTRANIPSNLSNSNKRGYLFYDYDLENIFQQEKLCKIGECTRSQLKSSSLSLDEALKNKTSAESGLKIPKKLHFVWVTDVEDKTKAKTFFATNNAQVLRFLKNNDREKDSWEKIFWVNDKSKLPEDVFTELERYGAIIRSLDDLEAELAIAQNNGKISKEEYSQYVDLFNLVKFYTTKKDYGSAADIYRALVEFLYGGVYIDGDYEITDLAKIQELAYKYDSFFGVERPPRMDYRLGNAFLASKQYGAIMKGYLDLIYRNTTSVFESDTAYQSNKINYFRFPRQWDMGVIMRTGPIALTVAFAKYKDKENSLLLNYCHIFTLLDDYGSCTTQQAVGNHLFAASWAYSV